jgi:hypothetical protein
MGGWFGGIEEFRFCKSIWFMSEANQAPNWVGLHAVMTFVSLLLGWVRPLLRMGHTGATWFCALSSIVM